MITVAAGVTIGLFVSQVIGELPPLPYTFFPCLDYEEMFYSLSVWDTQKCCTLCILIRVRESLNCITRCTPTFCRICINTS